MRAILLVATLVGGVLAGGRLDGGAGKKDQEAIQGNWVLISVEVDGKERLAKEAMKWAFKGEKFMNVKDGNVMVEGPFKLDPTRDPKEIDLVITLDKFEKKSDKELTPEERTVRGVYALDGDTLKLALGVRGGKRNGRFSSEGENRILFLKREK